MISYRGRNIVINILTKFMRKNASFPFFMSPNCFDPDLKLASDLIKSLENPADTSLKGLGHEIRIVLKWYGLIGLG